MAVRRACCAGLMIIMMPHGTEANSLWCCFAAKQYIHGTSSLSSSNDFCFLSSMRQEMPNLPGQFWGAWPTFSSPSRSQLATIVLLYQSRGCSRQIHAIAAATVLNKGVVQPFQRCGYYLRASTNQGWHLVVEYGSPSWNASPQSKKTSTLHLRGEGGPYPPPPFVHVVH